MAKAAKAKPAAKTTQIPDFKPGDTVRVYTRVREGDKERVQVFEGVVIKRKGSKLQSSFTVRKVSYGVGVERVFPLQSPVIERIEFVSRGKVRRAKLYYLRDLSGRKARLVAESFGWAAAPESPEAPPAEAVVPSATPEKKAEKSEKAEKTEKVEVASPTA